MKKIISQVIRYLNEDIWRLRIRGLQKRRAFLIRNLRVFVLALRGFDEDQVQLRASALTYYTLLSIVPIVAMIFGIAKGFNFDQRMEEELMKQFAGQEDVLKWILQYAHNMLENTKGGFIVGAGLVVLLWSVMKVLGNIERSFNDIWQINKSRVFIRKLSDYFTLMFIAPIFIFLSSSAQVYIIDQMPHIREMYVLGFFSPVIHFLVKIIPYVLIWLLLTIIYMAMPNTKVKFRSALIAGIIAGTIFQLLQWGYIRFQIGVSSYGAIYGSFAAFPLFLMWLYLSWLVVLFGAEISFSDQNVHRYEFESDTKHISTAQKRLLSLLITNYVFKTFAAGEVPMTATEISQKLEIPIRLVREIIHELMEVRIFSETPAEEYNERAYQPAKDIHLITVKDIIDALDHRGSEKIEAKAKEYKTLSDTVTRFTELVNQAKENVLIKDI